jgi:diguanylate cyclase (GGDEF)-like protein
VLSRPLSKVVEQAQAIQDRRFVTVDEPRTPELRAVVVAMNAMVVRLKNMFSDEAARLEELRRRVNHDPLTGLPNREFFLSVLRDRLDNEKAASEGCLALVRLSGLDRLNASLGHLQADRLIKELAIALKAFAGDHGDSLSARLNGADFALLVTGTSQPGKLADDIQSALRLSLCRSWPQIEDIFHAGVAAYRHGDNCGDVLSATDRALAFAENQEANAAHALDAGEAASTQRSLEAWRAGMNDALDDHRVRLEHYPVLSADNRLLHRESSARLQLDPGGAWLPAGDFMPMALRQNLSSAIDLSVVRIALDSLDRDEAEIAINLSAESIADWHFSEELATLLEARPQTCKRLWIEVPEYGAFRNFDAFRSFCRRLDRFGCKLGIEHFGQNFSQIASLAELGLDYLKIDSHYVRDIDTNTGNQEFLRGLSRVARNAGVQVIAEGVGKPAELDMLLTLGFDGATGQEITRRAAPR